MEHPLPKDAPGFTLQPVHNYLEKAKRNIDEMRKPLAAFAATIDGLQGETMQIALLGEACTRQEISDLRAQLSSQDQKHKDGVVEIQAILDDLLQNQVVEHMRKEVEQEISHQIDAFVQEQVAECLKDHIPQALQDEVEESKRELDRLNIALHNSESRRANGNLRTNQVDDLLATMFMPDGAVSPHFPKDLKGLFSLDGKSTEFRLAPQNKEILNLYFICLISLPVSYLPSTATGLPLVNEIWKHEAETTRALMDDYGIPNPSASRDHNLNRLMQFCGVRRAGAAGKH
ncbi:hypothetical protein NLJ89_g8581 [Agrocybe chaxingu]|uniref:Uncharacterized protein n=1 Tax=Agrocybe chaxingu TaxID=84603 RepID=A0A9W8JX88_9AGAR|nr:hypothetical protein NLJ89_g8581 [Agrocybe chaxingu]